MRLHTFIKETIVAGDVAKNTAKGKVDVVGGSKKKKKNSKLTGFRRILK